MRRSASKKSSRAGAHRPALTVRLTSVGGAITQISVSGHAGFAPAGRDVVCAGVSALVLPLAHGLPRYCGAEVRVRDDAAGEYVLTIAGGGNERAQAVLRTAVAGLRAIERSYPGYLFIRQRKDTHGNVAQRIRPSSKRTKA